MLALARAITDADAQAERSPRWPPRPPRRGTWTVPRPSPAPSPNPPPGPKRSPRLAAAPPGQGTGRASRLAADAEALARTITDPDAQAGALTQLATVAAQAGDADRTRHLLALATSADTREIGAWAGTVSRLFPSVIKDAGDVFLSAYRAKT